MGENTSKTRAITFPYVGVIQGSNVWRNSETGVEIIRDPNGLYYVGVPTMRPESRGDRPIETVAMRETLAQAREAATGHAVNMRRVIYMARLAAFVEDSERYDDCGGQAVAQRIVHRAQYEALREMLRQVDAWESETRRERAANAFREMINMTARTLGVREPWQGARP